MCSKNLKRAMLVWLPAYEAVEVVFRDDIRARLLSISAASIVRVLKPYKHLGRGRCVPAKRSATLWKSARMPLKLYLGRGRWAKEETYRKGYCGGSGFGRCCEWLLDPITSADGRRLLELFQSRETPLLLDVPHTVTRLRLALSIRGLHQYRCHPGQAGSQLRQDRAIW